MKEIVTYEETSEFFVSEEVIDIKPDSPCMGAEERSQFKSEKYGPFEVEADAIAKMNELKDGYVKNPPWYAKREGELFRWQRVDLKSCYNYQFGSEFHLSVFSTKHKKEVKKVQVV